jgi:hypothetical protein
MSVLSDEEIIERARKDVPEEDRAERYGKRNGDVNANWDLTRALLRQVDRQQAELGSTKRELRSTKAKYFVLAAILGGAAAKGIEISVLAVIHAFAR